MNKFILLAIISLTACSKTSAPLGPAEAAAQQTCKNTIESRAINRSSVAYTGGDAPIGKNAKGQLEVSLKFSAKNEIGMATTMQAKCTVTPDGNTLINIVVKE
jgi:hypothetical protein